MASKIAYGPAKRPEMDPKVAAKFFIDAEKAKISSYLGRSNLSSEERQRAQHALYKLKNMKVVNADRRGVGLLVSNPESGEKHIEYGFRGTVWSNPGDYATNARIAMNAKHIPRVEQAKTFAQETEALVARQVAPGKLVPSRYLGHSQGGVRRENLEEISSLLFCFLLFCFDSEMSLLFSLSLRLLEHVRAMRACRPLLRLRLFA